MFKVFISYSTRDLNSVTELHQSLNGTGVEVFVAEHSVSASEPLTDKISSATFGCITWPVSPLHHRLPI